MKTFFSTLFLVLILVLAGKVPVRAQGLDAAALAQLRQQEDTLIALADSMNHVGLPEERQGYLFRFVNKLKDALSVPNSFAYPFDSLTNHINIIGSSDGAFRIFNWALPANEMSMRYYGAIQLPSAGAPKLYGLVDYSLPIQKGASDSILTGGRWFGATYYRVMPITVDGETAYTLFGLNAANASSTRKIMEVLRFTPQGPVFGAPVFGVRSPDTKAQAVRFVLEYKKGVQVSLNWNEERQAVVYDHLESETNDPNRRYTYVPTGQYDGFRWQNGMWTMVKDLIPITILREGEQPIGGKD
jgi:hypothetical protein